MEFTVIDCKTGTYPDVGNIALHEEWAKRLMYCDIDCFAIQEDGGLILIDDCGNIAYPPAGRFRVIFSDDDRQPCTPLAAEQLKNRVGKPIWLSSVGCAGEPLQTYDIITKVTAYSMETLRGENLPLENCGKTWFAYENKPKEEE